MKSLLRRLCVWLAKQLTRKTACIVARRDEVLSLGDAAEELADYVARSGGLQDPRRIKAYRRVLRGSFEVRNHARAVLVK